MSTSNPTVGPLSGRHILLSGASGVLGRALALALAQQGAELILLARRKGNLERLDDAISAAGGPSPLLVELDFLRAEAAHYQELAQALEPQGLDAVILAAGLTTGLHPLEHLPVRDWQRIMDVNLNAPYLLIRHLLPLLKRSHGSLIGVSDAPGREHKAFWGAYAVSKAGLDALLNICAQECEGQVHVHRFEPGPLPSPIRGAVYPGEHPGTLPDVQDSVSALIALLG